MTGQEVADREPERVLGSYSLGVPGPLLFVCGGVHGNEPAGVRAARRVLAALEERRTPLRGRLVALACNLGALRAGLRYVDQDLNRIWNEETLGRVARGDVRTSEEREQRETLAAMAVFLQGGAGPGGVPQRVVLLDLHSTSAVGAPFSVTADTVQNRRLALAFPVPVLLGLEERLEGTLLSHFSEMGHTAVCLEGGQNEAPMTVEHHVAAVWIALVAAGLVRRADVPDMDALRARLQGAAAGLPRVVEVSHRHEIPAGEEFVMDPGHANFDWVERDEELATSNGRRVRTPSRGLLLMPRYQGQGNDGFFVGREVRFFWLWLSSWIRRLRLAWLPTLLPGVRRDPRRPRLVRVDPRIARWLVVELFHLFGYRRAGGTERELYFLRRPDAFDH